MHKQHEIHPQQQKHMLLLERRLHEAKTNQQPDPSGGRLQTPRSDRENWQLSPTGAPTPPPSATAMLVGRPQQTAKPLKKHA